jgi:hypothetical protein
MGEITPVICIILELKSEMCLDELLIQALFITGIEQTTPDWNSNEISNYRARKRRPFHTGDCLIEVTV